MPAWRTGLVEVGLVGGDGDGRVAVAVDVRVERVLSSRAVRRVGLDDRVEVAVDDTLHGGLRAVDGDEVGLGDAVLAGVGQSDQGADALLVVLGVDRVDLRVRLDLGLGDALALLPGEVGGLLGDRS